MPIIYVSGDATEPQGPGNKIIAHVCNDIGAWGAGFVKALSLKWPQPELEYKVLKAQKSPNLLELGTVQFVRTKGDVDDSIWIANMIGQRGIKNRKDGSTDDSPPIRYPAVLKCLDEVGKFAVANNASIHAPRFGAGLAGGDWDVIEAIIEKVLINKHGRQVTIYDLEIL